MKNPLYTLLYMSDIKLKWMSKVKHLGNVLNSQLSDKDDIIFKQSCFYHYVNKMIVLFGWLITKSYS